MEGYNKKVIMSYWTICRMKTTKKIYVKVSIIFLLGGILLFSSCEKEENQKIEANRKTLFMYLPWSSNLTKVMCRRRDLTPYGSTLLASTPPYMQRRHNT